jgi:hypothetical protein
MFKYYNPVFILCLTLQSAPKNVLAGMLPTPASGPGSGYVRFRTCFDMDAPHVNTALFANVNNIRAPRRVVTGNSSFWHPNSWHANPDKISLKRLVLAPCTQLHTKAVQARRHRIYRPGYVTALLASQNIRGRQLCLTCRAVLECVRAGNDCTRAVMLSHRKDCLQRKPIASHKCLQEKYVFQRIGQHSPTSLSGQECFGKRPLGKPAGMPHSSC